MQNSRFLPHSIPNVFVLNALFRLWLAPPLPSALGFLPQEAFARESYEFRKQWQSDTHPKARLGNTKSRERFASAWLKEEGVKKFIFFFKNKKKKKAFC